MKLSLKELVKLIATYLVAIGGNAYDEDDALTSLNSNLFDFAWLAE